MQVHVRLSIILRRGRFAERTLEVAEGTRVAELLRTLEIDPSEVAITSVNARYVQPDHVLQEGDEVCLYPPTAGG